MAEENIETKAGLYCVDWDAASEIIESFHRASCAADTAKVVKTNESEWYNPFSWSMPDVKTVEIDWETCAARASEATRKDVELYKRNFETDAPTIVSEILQKEIGIRRKRDQLRSMMDDVQKFNASSLESSENQYENSLTAAKWIRDGSSGVLLLGSTFVTGGTSLALLGGGSVLTGVAKYQDTGSVGAGFLAGGGTMVLGAFSIGGRAVNAAGKAVKMSASQKSYLILAKGGLETATGLTAGDNLGDALWKGASTVVAEGAVAKLFDARVVKTIFRGMPMPVKVTATGGIRARGFMTKSLGREFVSGTTKWAGKKLVKDGLKNAGPHVSSPATSGPLAAATPIPSTGRTSSAFSAVRKP